MQLFKKIFIQVLLVMLLFTLNCCSKRSNAVTAILLEKGVVQNVAFLLNKEKERGITKYGEGSMF